MVRGVDVVVGAAAEGQALEDPDGEKDGGSPESDEEIHDVNVALLGDDQLVVGRKREGRE